MSSTLKWTVMLLLVAGVVSVTTAEQSIGMHADFMAQGVTYRLLSKQGFGLGIIGSAVYRKENNSAPYYNAGGEIRLVKLMNPEKRFRFFMGAGVGAWLVQAETFDLDAYDIQWVMQQRWGMSTAFIVGADWLLLEIGDNWISVAPELQIGYYSNPSVGFGGDFYESPSTTLFLPGVGLGVHYVW